MAKPGPKGKANYIKVVNGTDQPCRTVDPAHAELEGAPVKPTWLKKRGARIWKEKIEKYEARGQSVAGYEDSLASYCALEARLIEDFYRRELTPPASLVNAHRVYANEFFDTPASNNVGKGKGKSGNEFGQHGLPFE